MLQVERSLLFTSLRTRQSLRPLYDAWPKALPGFKVDLYASGFQSARKILTAPNGDFFVTDSTAGEVKVFRGRKADGTAEQTSVFATGTPLNV